MPTCWARQRIARHLAEATGRPARVGSLELGLLGGVRIGRLESFDVGQTQDPWLRVERLDIDLNLASLLIGRLEPGKVMAEGVFVRVRRRHDGTFDLAEMLRSRPAPERMALISARKRRGDPFVIARLLKGRAVLIDEPTDTVLHLEGVEGRGTWTPTLASLDEMHGRMNGGPFLVTGRLDRNADAPRVDAQLSARDVAVGAQMDLLRLFAPVLTGARATMGGELALDCELRARGTNADELAESLTGTGTVRLDRINLEGSQLVNELARLVRHPADDHVGSFTTDFAIAQRRICSRDMALTIGRAPIHLSGSTDFSGRVDYVIQADDLASRVSPETRLVLGDLPFKLADLVSLRVEGTTRRLKLKVDIAPDDGTPDSDDRLKLERLGRRLLDRIRR
jgi:AsmA protein